MTIKTQTITFSAIATAVAVLAALNGIAIADAVTCTTSSHCYATIWQSNYNNYGLKADYEIDDLDEGGNCSTNHHMVVMPLWMKFSDGKWIEIGIGEGRMDNWCYVSETLYTYDSQNSDWDIHGPAGTIGNTYEFKISQSSGNTWKLYYDGTVQETITVASSQGRGSLGAEITDSSAQIDEQRRDVIQRQSSSGGSWSNLTTSNAQDGSEDSPPYKDICTSYSDILFGDTDPTC